MFVILAAQDDETGGCADQPGNISDPFHTLFWVAGLLLLNMYDENIIRKVNSVLLVAALVSNDVYSLPAINFTDTELSNQMIKTLSEALLAQGEQQQPIRADPRSKMKNN
ncbi:unnamed protein product [Rotaria sordida]|uniref:Prenyltransferase alpha-alpha toroid domain-containing protein n=1 Tax=Rotaria sordida TaxID=392033 RepID=A0A819JL14_9BILA|nr:unnamed protein product [Rotaria sordida]